MLKNEVWSENKMLSIVIPVYNVEPYLSKCIESVLCQTYKNIEILLIDDGSTDNTGQICDSYQKKNKHIRVYHVKHGGTSKARNIGLYHAIGEFVGFVDGDDYICSDMYENMLDEMKDGVDIVTCGRYIVFPKETHKNCIPIYFTSRCITMDSIEAVSELLRHRKFSFSVCDKVFRRKLFEDILFPDGRTCEDIPVTYKLFSKSRLITHIGTPKYLNFHRNNSSSRHDFYYRRIDQVLFAGEICKDIAENCPQLSRRAEALFVEYLIYTIKCIKICSNRQKYATLEKRLHKALLRMSIRIWCNNCIEQDQKRLYLSEIFGDKNFLLKKTDSI